MLDCRALVDPRIREGFILVNSEVVTCRQDLRLPTGKKRVLHLDVTLID
jgi:hypothetical protein